MSEQNTFKRERMMLFESLVERRIVIYKQPNKYSQLCNTMLDVKEHSLKATIDKYFHKVPVNYNDWMGDCIFEIYQALQNFKPASNDWTGVICKTNKKSYSKMIRFLKTKIKFLSMKGYSRGYETTKQIGDRKVHVYVELIGQSTYT